MMTEDGYGKGLAPAIFCCGAGTVRSDQWNRPRDPLIGGSNGNADDWLKCVENKAFQKYFGSPQASSFKTPTDVSSWDQPQGFGLEKLKTCPSGFPRDWAHIEYLRMKDYCCWHQVPDNFYQGEKWLDEIEPMFKTAKPMMDFINSVIDDYE